MTEHINKTYIIYSLIAVQQLECQTPERPKVNRAGVCLLSVVVHHLRCKESHGPDTAIDTRSQCRHRNPSVVNVREAKVAETDVVSPVDEHVLRFDVTMDDPDLV